MRRLPLILLALFIETTFAQEQDKVDFYHADANIAVNANQRMVLGEVVYTFEALEKVDSVYLDARNMMFNSVLLDDRKVKYSNDGNRIIIKKKFKEGKKYQLALKFSTQPKQTVYFVGWDQAKAERKQVWTQGQGKYTSHWLPSFDDMTEKVEFDLSISFDAAYDVVANGEFVGVKTKENKSTWSFNMTKPMSSYLLAFGIGDYEKKELVSESNVPIELYYYPEDSLKVEPTYRYTKRIFDFLEKEIGVPYPWQNYKQLPVRDFLYAGMENTGTTLFSDSYVIDSVAFADKNYVNVNAHEMAHQWFGNLVTEKDGNHHWLHEGFATYYAYLAEKELFGEEYFCWKFYETARALDNLQREDRGEALTDPKASSLTFYEKGAWALYMLRAKIGDTPFKQGIKSYLEKFKYKNATIADFLNEMEIASGLSLADFEKLWLQGRDFPYEQAMEQLKKSSESLRKFSELQWELTTSRQANEEIIKRYWNNTESVYFRKNSIQQYHKSLSENFLSEAFNTGDLRIRQALASSLEQIPVGLETKFESLLEDKSYVTLENALYKLWIYAPEHRGRYLEKTKNIVGLPNKNIRILWLLLASLTKDYLDEEDRQKCQQELLSYTAPNHPFEVRQYAFAIISEVFPMSEENLKDLVNASVHHAWQFRKYARSLLDKTLSNDKQKQRLQQLVKELKGEELRYIKSKLELE